MSIVKQYFKSCFLMNYIVIWNVTIRILREYPQIMFKLRQKASKSNFKAKKQKKYKFSLNFSFIIFLIEFCCYLICHSVYFDLCSNFPKKTQKNAFFKDWKKAEKMQIFKKFFFHRIPYWILLLFDMSHGTLRMLRKITQKIAFFGFFSNNSGKNAKFKKWKKYIFR